jgi:hypothetical protein
VTRSDGKCSNEIPLSIEIAELSVTNAPFLCEPHDPRTANAHAEPPAHRRLRVTRQIMPVGSIALLAASMDRLRVAP